MEPGLEPGMELGLEHLFAQDPTPVAQPSATAAITGALSPETESQEQASVCWLAGAFSPLWEYSPSPSLGGSVGSPCMLRTGCGGGESRVVTSGERG